MVNDDQEGPTSTPDRRLDSLESRLERAKHREAERTGSGPKKADASEQMGNRVLSTLIGGIAGGALLGWVMDRWFQTGHLLLVVMMVLGTVAAFWSIFKLVSRQS